MPLNRDYQVRNAIQEILSTYGDVVSVDAKAKNLIKFGRNDDLGTSFETVWVQGGDETYATGNDIDSISSSDDGDTQQITVEGHTVSGGDLTFVTQNVTLTGQTPATLGTSLYRSSRAFNNSGTVLAGDVYVFESGGAVTAGVPQTDADIHLKLLAADNQSLKCATSLSSVDYWIITGFTVSANRNSQSRNVDFKLQIQDSGKVFRTRLTASASTDGGAVHVPLAQAIIAPPNSDVRTIAASSGTSTIVQAAIHGYLAIVQ